MNKLALFEATLKRFAENGDRDAALVLELAGIIPTNSTSMIDDIGESLRLAITYCTDAMTAGSEWQTDENIKTSINHISNALKQLAQVQ